MHYVKAEDGGLPETGEWIMSRSPNEFDIVLANDTGLLPGIDRIAFILTLGDQEEKEGGFDTQCSIGLWTINGKFPGDPIEKTPDSEEAISMLTGRIQAAVNGWHENLTEEERIKFWRAAQPQDQASQVLDILKELIGGKAD